MNIHPTTANDFCDDIRAGKKFSFSRFNDGEWISILGRATGHNTDKHPYTPELTRDLTACLVNTPHPRLGLGPAALRKLSVPIEEWLVKEGLSDLEWVDTDIFLYELIRATQAGEVFSLVELLRAKETFASVIVVGPRRLRALDRIFGVTKFVQIPIRNCYAHMDMMWDGIQAALDAVPKPVVVSFSASMPANILVHRLHAERPEDGWFLDLGSLWMPYVGRRTRSWHKELPTAPLVD